MLTRKVQKALNNQINAELYSAYLYLSMSNWFVLENFPGMATWMKVQASEEQGHAMRIYDYLQSRNSEVILKITGMINDIVDLALAERDHATVSFLNWFVDEQVEEEASVLEVADKLKMVKGHAGSMFLLDQDLGRRVPEPEGQE